MNEMTQQAEFCRMMAERLAKSVAVREEALQKSWYFCVGETVQAVQGAGKTQIKTDITRLRRELLLLSQMVEEG